MLFRSGEGLYAGVGLLVVFFMCFTVWLFWQFLMLQIKFFHKVGSMAAPVTDTDKLIWSVLEAERPTIRYTCKLFIFLIFQCFSIILFILLQLPTECVYVIFLCSQLHEKSLIEGNMTFLEQHKG